MFVFSDIVDWKVCLIMKCFWRHEVNYEVINTELVLRICKDMHIVTIFRFVVRLDFIFVPCDA